MQKLLNFGASSVVSTSYSFCYSTISRKGDLKQQKEIGPQ